MEELSISQKLIAQGQGGRLKSWQNWYGRKEELIKLDFHITEFHLSSKPNQSFKLVVASFQITSTEFDKGATKNHYFSVSRLFFFQSLSIWSNIFFTKASGYVWINTSMWYRSCPILFFPCRNKNIFTGFMVLAHFSAFKLSLGTPLLWNRLWSAITWRFRRYLGKPIHCNIWSWAAQAWSDLRSANWIGDRVLLKNGISANWFKLVDVFIQNLIKSNILSSWELVRSAIKVATKDS